MPIVFLALVAAAYAYAMVALPRFRVPGLALGALICLALALYVWRTDPEAAAARVRIAPSELTLDQLSLRQVGRGAALQGRVMNGSSAFRLREMTLTLRLRDCPAEDAEPASCPIIGESTATARPDAPPGQIRGFDALFVFANVQAVTGVLRWDWEIAETRATE